MPESLLREMTADVDVEALQKKARQFTRDVDWEKFGEIDRRYVQKIGKQTRKYEQDYDRRTLMATKQIASARGEDFDKLQRSRDPRSKQLTKLIRRAAHRDVQHDHRNRIAVIRERQASELRGLIDTVRARDAGPDVTPRLLTDRRNDADRQALIRKR